MTENKNQTILYTQTEIIYNETMFKFPPAIGFKQIDPKEFDSNKYTSNSSKVCVQEVDLEYPEELRQLRNDYSLAPDKIDIKREMLSDY